MAAQKTGGSLKGFSHAATSVPDVLGATPGTHGAVKKGPGCLYYDFWKNGELEAVEYKHDLPLNDLAVIKMSPSEWIRDVMKRLGGKHQRLPKEHEEQAIVWNPFVGVTEGTIWGKRLKVDDWAYTLFGIPQRSRLTMCAEMVEKVMPQSAKIEIPYF